ncbi:MAG: FlgD immunoglobulin-like domain containing protein [Candidatus Cloacimonadota bacterium]|nr:FlgD immunoglobulin-like domain containing protein [Candidatus Cloacimonadota bacterium]
MKKFSFVVIILFPFFLIAFAIEVGGHLTEDTTWSPDNNPYLVIENLYVDSGVTLTILPGTEVKIISASCTSWQELDQNFSYQNGTNIAKMFWVDGKIIAEGDEENRIIFTRLQNDPNYAWGTMYFTENADMSIFKYCDFSYSAIIGIVVGLVAKGPLSLRNGRAIIRRCNFLNNCVGISSERDTKVLEITNNSFILDENINPFMYDMWSVHIQSYRFDNNDFPFVLIANNTFEGNGNYQAVYAEDLFFPFNSVYNCQGVRSYGNYFSNEFINCENGIENTTSTSGPLFIKNNRFIGGVDGIDIDQAYIEISDNYFEGCDLDTGYDSDGEIFNNELDNGEVFIGIDMEFYNNLVINYSGSNATFSAYYVHNLGNLFYNNENTFSNNNDNFHTNCVILQSNDLFWWPTPNGTDTFRNCIIDFELEYPLIDGGGNIIVDSLQAQSIFEDIQNGDFHLAPGSIAIDAGFDTLGYYYPFDLDYNTRVWDGDNNGTAIIDIGPYEFGSPTFGGIEGYTYNPTTGDPVDYVLLKINNQPGEFTFSDSIGNFEYRLPTGIYDVYAERVFYEDVIEYQVEVIDGEFTQLDIPMSETVDIEENEIVNATNNFNLTNYPNPFNPETKIVFDLPESGQVELEIYNIKGQKVKTLMDAYSSKGHFEITWHGVDDNKKKVASGQYFIKLKVNGKEKDVSKCILLK